MGGNKEVREYRRKKRKAKEKAYRESGPQPYDPASLGMAGPAGRAMGSIVRGVGKGVSYAFRGLGASVGELVEAATGADTYSLEEFKEQNRRKK